MPISCRTCHREVCKIFYVFKLFRFSTSFDLFTSFNLFAILMSRKRHIWRLVMVCAGGHTRVCVSNFYPFTVKNKSGKII